MGSIKLPLTEGQALAVDFQVRKIRQQPGKIMMFGAIFAGTFPDEPSQLFLHASVVDKKAAIKIHKAIKESQERQITNKAGDRARCETPVSKGRACNNESRETVN